MKKFLFALACLAFYNYSFAQTITWDGGAGNSDWFDALNWDTDALPGPTDEVFIEDATVLIAGTMDVTVQRLYLFGSADLTIDPLRSLSVSGFAGNDEGIEIQL